MGKIIYDPPKTQYAVRGWMGLSIQTRLIAAETDKSVWVAVHGRLRRQDKSTTDYGGYAWADSPNDAVNAAVETETAKINDLQARAARCQRTISAINALRDQQ